MTTVIKGVNRHVIEVSEVDSAYYERALLVLRPEYASAEREILEKEARRMLREFGAPPGAKRRARLLYWGWRLAAAAAAGAGVMAACVLL